MAHVKEAAVGHRRRARRRSAAQAPAREQHVAEPSRLSRYQLGRGLFFFTKVFVNVTKTLGIAFNDIGYVTGPTKKGRGKKKKKREIRGSEL